MQLRRLLAASLALAAVGFAGCADPNAKIAAPGAGTSGGTAAAGDDALPAVVASADGIEITAAELESATATQVFEQRQQIFETRANWAQNEIAKRLIKREAEKVNMSFDDFLAKTVDGGGRPISDSDVKMFFQSNPQMMKKPDGSAASFEEMKDKVRGYLENQSKMSARQAYVGKLMEDNHVKVDLPRPEPPVVNVSVDDDPAKGSKDAPVTVIEFSDFQCPACRQAYQHLDEVLSKYGDRVHFVYRDYPLLGKHPNAFPAALAANCVRSLGGDDKYWSFHDKLFQNQSALGPDDLKKYAADLKIDANKYTACLTDPKMAAEIRKDMDDADAAGVNSTPTFFVNGRIVPGGSNMMELQRAIDKELKRTGA